MPLPQKANFAKKSRQKIHLYDQKNNISFIIYSNKALPLLCEREQDTSMSIKGILKRRLPRSVVNAIKKRRYARQIQSVTEQSDPDFTVIKHLISSGDHIVDLGANMGHYTKYFSELAGSDGKVYDLNVVTGKSEFLSGISTPTLGINGAYLGPTIRCRENDRVTLRARNSLSESTTLHWHGLRVPAASDGGPHQIIEPDAVWETSFAIKQKAALCWYHSHLMGHTGEQVLRGLAGLFLIEDDQSHSLNLPSDYGVDDIPLVIQDRRFRDDGSFDYALTMHDTMMGYKGNVVLVNGTANPHVILRRQRTRLRVLNGSNSRIYTLGRDDGAELIVIGSDGGLLERPARLSRVRLGPGERAEMLVDMQTNQTVRLMSYPDRVIARAVSGKSECVFG